MKHLPLICLAATLLAAQATAPVVEITNEPHHHLTFENKSVRVFNVEVAPNTQTLTHWHRHDYFAVNLGPAEVSNTVKDKPPYTVRFVDGDTRFSTATFAHYVRDTGPEPFRNVTIEILDDATLRATAGKSDTTHEKKARALEILSGGTAQMLFIRDGIRATEYELQPGGIVPMHHHAGPHLLVAVSDLDLRDDIQSDDKAAHPISTPTHAKSGDSKWLPGAYSHSLTNIGTKPAKFVTLEFP